MSGTVQVVSGGTGTSTITGLVKGNGTNAMSAAISGTDYLAPTGSAAALTNFPTLNQNTTGNAATATKLAAPKNINGVAFDGSADITIAAAASTLSGTVQVANGGTGLITAGLTGQVLTTVSSGTLSWTTPSTTATAYSGTLPVANGGTGSATKNFVDLTTGQYINGAKTFKENILVNYGTDGTQAVRIGEKGGNYNTMFGAATFLYGTPGSYNTAIGGFALSSLNGGNENTAVGLNAIRQGGAANGSRNTAVGVAALTNGSETNDNTAIGTYTLAGSTTGGSNVAVGNYVLQNNTTASYNVGIGYETLRSTTTGGNNTAIGHGSMKSNTSGDVNTAVGENSLISNTVGRYNTAIGVQSQEQNTTGQSNTAIGVAAIDRNTAGHYNAVLGAFAGRYIADGATDNTAINNSVLVGALSRPLANNANNEIVIGYDAIGNGSNSVTLGNSSISKTILSGSVAIGINSPDASAKLDVSSTSSGFLPPRMSNAQRNAISSPVAGLTVWCSNCGTNGEMQVYNGTAWTNMIGGTASVVPSYTIGQAALGGKIAYILQTGDPGYDANEQHGLIAAASDQGTAEWGCIYTYIAGAQGEAIGTGNQNTIGIMNGCGTAGIAARICGDLVLNGYSDWYLPSKDELNKLYINRVAIGGFGNVSYWSSSEPNSSENAWYHYFDDGHPYPYYGPKNNSLKVRAIRAF